MQWWPSLLLGGVPAPWGGPGAEHSDAKLDQAQEREDKEGEGQGEGRAGDVQQGEQSGEAGRGEVRMSRLVNCVKRQHPH